MSLTKSAEPEQCWKMLTNTATSYWAQQAGAHARWSRHHEFGSGSQHILSAKHRRQQTQSSSLSFAGGASTVDVTLKALLTLIQIFHPPFNLFISASLLSSSLRLPGAETHSTAKHQKWVWPLMIRALQYYLSVQPFLCNLLFPFFHIPFSTSLFIFFHHPSMLTSTQFPSTSWKRTQKGSDLEATSRSSRLVAVTDSSTRVTQCWGATLRVWPSGAEPRV